LEPASTVKFIYYNKGTLLQELKQWDASLVAFEQVIQLDPTDTHAYSYKGCALEELGRWEEALVAYEQVIQMKLRSPNLFDGTFLLGSNYRDKGRVLEKLKRWEEALEAYEQAIRLEPAAPSLYGEKGRVLEELERWEEALATYEQTSLSSFSSTAHFSKGRVLKKLGRLEQTLATYEQTILRDVGLTIPPPRERERALAELKQIEKERSERLFFDDREYCHQGVILLGLGQPEEARQAFKQATLGKNEYTIQAYFGEGLAHKALGQIEEALDDYAWVIWLSQK
jgi:tetratricopeptide (TPR) repeat protein